MKLDLAPLVQRKVFANALMVLFLAGGLISAATIRQELMPAQAESAVQVTVELPGASPDEVDRAVLMAVENAVRGLDGIKRVDARAREGSGEVTLRLLDRADPQQVLGEVKIAVDRIATLPQGAEKPAVSIPSQLEKTLSIVVYGDQPLAWLHRTAERVRDDLRTQVGLRKVQLAFPRDHEIAVEIPEAILHQYDLSLAAVAASIEAGALETPSGMIFSDHADIVLRTNERRKVAAAFADIVIARGDRGLPVRLGDVAHLSDGFGPSPVAAWFNGKPAIQIDVFAAGGETPIAVAAAVQNYLDTTGRKAHPGVEMVVFENQAAAYRSRMALLVDNALLGLLLVLVTLGLFLTPQLAFWVMVGIPTALLGGLLLLPLFGASLNMLSLFAFIVTIGVVVDDAIMMGEAIHVHRSRGMAHLQAAVCGLKEMGGPVLLATLTTIIAFMPAFFIPGAMGVLFRQIPAVVVAVLLVSLVEALFILPAHLAVAPPASPWMQRLARPQAVVNAHLERFIQGGFRRWLTAVLGRPLVVIAGALALVAVTIGAVAGGLLEFSFTPVIEADTVIAQATLPYGSPRRRSVAVQRRLVASAQAVLKANHMRSPGIFSLMGTRLEEGEVEIESLAGSHYVSVLMGLPPAADRPLAGGELAAQWEAAFGPSDGLEALNFTGETRVGGGEPIQLEVFHPDPTVARAAARSLGIYLRAFPGLTAVDDGLRVGKPQLDIRLQPHGLQMGLTAAAVAAQVRHRFHGAEAQRFVREGNEVRVMVRLSAAERASRDALEAVLLRGPSGALVPLSAVAQIDQSRAFTTVARRDGKRIYPVTADIRLGLSDDVVEAVLEEQILPRLRAAFPGVRIAYGGDEEEETDALGALGVGFLVALSLTSLLLILHFNTYLQPLLVLSVIPFSFIGAVWGHILLGYDLSIVSLIGVVAMTGVVVNDSLVLVTAYNRRRASGEAPFPAILNAACQRFRPILLTTLTTFFGLMPLLLETSEQAQFLIPAAVSLSFGLLFGTVITLVLVPGFVQLFARDGQAQGGQ